MKLPLLTAALLTVLLSLPACARPAGPVGDVLAARATGREKKKDAGKKPADKRVGAYTYNDKRYEEIGLEEWERKHLGFDTRRKHGLEFPSVQTILDWRKTYAREKKRDDCRPEDYQRCIEAGTPCTTKTHFCASIYLPPGTQQWSNHPTLKTRNFLCHSKDMFEMVHWCDYVP